MSIRLTKVKSFRAHCVGYHLGPLQVSPLSACMDYWPYSASHPACCEYVASLCRAAVCRPQIVITLRQEGHCFLVVCSSPWPRKEFDWNGDVATGVDCVPQRLNSLRNIYPKG